MAANRPPTTRRPRSPRQSPRQPQAAVVLPGPRSLPPGLPREWYVRHNRQIKAMRLAIALLNTGVYSREEAGNGRIRSTAEHIGVHPPSAMTCQLVRAFLPDAHQLTA